MARSELESVQLGLRHDLTAQSREIQQLREKERELHVSRERGEGGWHGTCRLRYGLAHPSGAEGTKRGSCTRAGEWGTGFSLQGRGDTCRLCCGLADPWGEEGTKRGGCMCAGERGKGFGLQGRGDTCRLRYGLAHPSGGEGAGTGDVCAQGEGGRDSACRAQGMLAALLWPGPPMG